MEHWNYRICQEGSALSIKETYYKAGQAEPYAVGGAASLLVNEGIEELREMYDMVGKAFERPIFVVPAEWRFRAGDYVRHIPTGETWVLAGVEGDRVFWCGWPEGCAEGKDCDLVKPATDEEHRRVLEEWIAVKGSDCRIGIAKRALDRLMQEAK